jgi:hypothetical protein
LMVRAVPAHLLSITIIAVSWCGSSSANKQIAAKVCCLRLLLNYRDTLRRRSMVKSLCTARLRHWSAAGYLYFLRPSKIQYINLKYFRHYVNIHSYGTNDSGKEHVYGAQQIPRGYGRKDIRCV